MLKTIFKLLSFAAVVLVGAVTFIKITQGTSFREAMGILEELCKDMSKNCCCRHRKAEEPVSEA